MRCASNAVKAISRGSTSIKHKCTNCKTTTLDYVLNRVFFLLLLLLLSPRWLSCWAVNAAASATVVVRCSFLTWHAIKNGVRVMMITCCWLGPLNRQCFVYFRTICFSLSLVRSLARSMFCSGRHARADIEYGISKKRTNEKEEEEHKMR